MEKKRVTEPGLYEVSHNEGTHLVESKRVRGEKHSTAYADSGKRADNDPVTLRRVDVETAPSSWAGGLMHHAMIGVEVGAARAVETTIDIVVARLVDAIGYGLSCAWRKARAAIRSRCARSAAQASHPQPARLSAAASDEKADAADSGEGGLPLKVVEGGRS